MKFEISAEKREAQGTGASRRLRRIGKVPGIANDFHRRSGNQTVQLVGQGRRRNPILIANQN